MSTEQNTLFKCEETVCCATTKRVAQHTVALHLNTSSSGNEDTNQTYNVFCVTPKSITKMLAKDFLPFCHWDKHDMLHHQRHYQERIKTMLTQSRPLTGILVLSYFPQSVLMHISSSSLVLS